jgi:hypothetical protein
VDDHGRQRWLRLNLNAGGTVGAGVCVSVCAARGGRAAGALGSQRGQAARARLDAAAAAAAATAAAARGRLRGGDGGEMGAASVSRAAAHSWLASEQHRAHDRSTAGRGAAQRQVAGGRRGPGRAVLRCGGGSVRGVGSANDSMHKSSLGRCAPLTAQHVEAGSKRQRLPEGWKLFAPHNPPQPTETGSLDARRLAAAASGQRPSLLACAVAWPTRGTLGTVLHSIACHT